MDKCICIAKKELIYAFPFGFAIWLSGFMFIDRKNPVKAKQDMSNVIAYLKKTNTKLWVYPEGTRRNTNEIHQFKKGAFYTAIQGQIPIMPVSFSSYHWFFDGQKYMWNPGHIIVTALEPIPTKGLTVDDVDGELKNCTSRILKSLTHKNSIFQVLRKKLSNSC